MTREDIDVFILKHSSIVRDYEKYRNYYKSKHTEILNAKPKPDYKPDNRLVINHAKKIVDTYSGFAVGKPIQISLTEDLANTSLAEFNRSRNMDTVISRVWKESSIFGRAYFYVYGDNGEIRVTNTSPLNTFVIYDDTVAHKPLYAVRYSTVGMGLQKRITLYSDKFIYEISEKNAGMGQKKANPFDLIPIVEVVENDERLGLIENVITLIDEVDKAISEKSNDVAYFADAYLKVLGALLTDEQLKNLRDKRVINMKSAETEDDTPESLEVDFLSKPNADGTQENLLNRVIDNIYQMSMIVNLNDKDFGNSTGVALEMKYKPMLSLATLKSRLFSESLKRMYQVVFASNLIKNVGEKAWKDLDISFQYDLPHDVLSEVQTAQALASLGVSTETWLKVISVVNDPKQEEDKMLNEQKQQFKNNLEMIASGNIKPDGEVNDNGPRREE
ncbi:phage portal protein [Ligilactobacillus hayakitensis]|uniref:phage portal protein n=1 Tax=Ligilactobacillus hayakitensis TaxID=396716 RepID=UPI00068648F6|nr:phage portal protein [Ligilactobacillus hayakitensis]